MLQLPDFKEKQIVFIGLNKEEKVSTLKVKNENLVIYDQEGELLNKISCSRLFAVFIMGDFTITSYLIKKLLSYGAAIIMTNKYSFRVFASINASAEGNYLLRYKQYQFKDELTFARKLVLNKIKNQLSLIKEYRPEFFNKKSKHKLIKEYQLKIDRAVDLNELMGIEGVLSKTYFQNLFENYDWYKRLPRTKMDINNLLLDIGYTILFNFIDCLLLLHGFDTYKGIYHQLYFQRKSLTCDIEEPFRCLIDKALLRAYGLKRVKMSDFKKTKKGYYLKINHQEKYLRIFTEELMKNKEEIFKYVKKFYFAILNDSKDFPEFNY